MKSHRILPVPAVLIIALIVASPVYAYTDPGSGVLMLQLLLASLAGAAFHFRRGIAWFSRRVMGKKPVEDVQAAPDDRIGNDS